MNDNTRRMVLESLSLAGVPMVPGGEFDSSRLPAGEEPGGRTVYQEFPGINSRLVISLSDGEIPTVRGDKLYEVHYHLLALAALGDYADENVYFTARGLAKEMAWADSGQNLQRIRHAIDYLWATTIEYEGEMKNHLLPGTSTQTLQTRILINRGFPRKEQRTSGMRHLSWVAYNPMYLKSIKENPVVQLDIELLSQIPGTLAKGFYRTAIWLHARNRETVPLDELFERAGSTRRGLIPSQAKRFFGPAWDLMRTYRYFRSPPEAYLDDQGRWHIRFDWGDPIINIPRRGDLLFRTLVQIGVTQREAQRMIVEDEARIRRIVQTFKAGALGTPRTTPAAMIAGLYRSPDWDVTVQEAHQEQMNLLPTETTEQYVIEKRTVPGSPEPSWEALLRWDTLFQDSGDWIRYRNEILVPVFRFVGEAAPEALFSIPSLNHRLRAAYEQAGWKLAIEAVYRAEEYLKNAERPASYLARILESIANPAQPAHAAAPIPESGKEEEANVPQPVVPPPPHLWADFKKTHFESWLQELRESPTQMNARSALAMIESRYRAGTVPEEYAEVCGTIQQVAEGILNKSGNPKRQTPNEPS